MSEIAIPAPEIKIPVIEPKAKSNPWWKDPIGTARGKLVLFRKTEPEGLTSAPPVLERIVPKVLRAKDRRRKELNATGALRTKLRKIEAGEHVEKRLWERRDWKKT